MESDQTWDMIQRAAKIEDSDGPAAFHLYLEAAEAGSTWSLYRVGWCYWTGTGVAADPWTALDYYHRAICGGSWMATIHYARLLAELGHHEDCERSLEDGVAYEFVSAYFWLAWFRYQRSRTSETCREVRPLLEYAAEKGHPGAKVVLAQWMAIGNFGLRNVPRGICLVVREALNFAVLQKQVPAP